MHNSSFQFSDIRHKPVIAVCCAGKSIPEEEELSYEVGKEIAKRDAVLVCGGLGGSMEACCKGANEEGGLTIGIIPVYEKKFANPWVDVVIPTGLGHARNNLVIATADGVIGVGGSWGTLSELAIALKMDKPVVVLAGWSVKGPNMDEKDFIRAATLAEAVAVALGEYLDQSVK